MQNIDSFINEKLGSEDNTHPKTKAALLKTIRFRVYKFGFDCDLNDIDVSNITDMSELFTYQNMFNGDISKWNVSKVKNMKSMFAETDFNGDISNWDVSNVKDMSFMFFSTEFNQDISKWDVSHVTTMGGMFVESLFNGDISKWNVGNVKDMHHMFEFSVFNTAISNWNVSKVKYMHSMFENSVFNQDISKWNVSKVEDMSFMFKHSVFNKDISSWNINNVTNNDFMFEKSKILNRNMPNFENVKHKRKSSWRKDLDKLQDNNDTLNKYMKDNNFKNADEMLASLSPEKRKSLINKVNIDLMKDI